jgi:predicted HD phosphohydrolase
MSAPEPRAHFTAMTDGTAAEWKIIEDASAALNRTLADRVLDHLKLLKGEYGGFVVDRYEHSLQSASRALRDGHDEEYVTCALLHDVGDTLASHNHAELAATILHPFVSEANHWLLEKHGVFQGYYFFQYCGLDRNMRERFRGHPHFERTALFCERHDQNAFDPAYDTLPLDAFVPMVRRVLAQPKRSIYLPETAPVAQAVSA